MFITKKKNERILTHVIRWLDEKIIEKEKRKTKKEREKWTTSMMDKKKGKGERE